MSAPGANRAVFVNGSTFGHVTRMTLTASAGLMAIFVVDILSLLYVSWLGRPATTAGVGFATIILFVATSVNIGMMIAVGALVSRALGAGQREEARQLAGSTVAIAVLIGALTAALLWPFLPMLLGAMGARGEARDVALSFLHITLPSNVLMAAGMALSGSLRAVGDGRRSMYVTLSGGIATALLDPLMIFGTNEPIRATTTLAQALKPVEAWGLGLGSDGAALAIVLARIIFVLVGLWGAVHVHRLVARPRWAALARHWPVALAIAGPAVITNLATPFANAFTTRLLAAFGDKAVAGAAIIDRVVPVAFGVLFALSGAIGPILGQNWGAGRYDRMRRALTDALIFAGIYVTLAGIGLWFGRHLIIDAFNATGLTAELVLFFAAIGGPMWLALGGLFVANAAFNNLGFPLYSTALNWGRATLGTIPLAWLGGEIAGAKGILAGIAVGGGLFGLLSIGLAYRTIGVLERRAAAIASPDPDR